jgi:hypothetical protein
MLLVTVLLYPTPNGKVIFLFLEHHATNVNREHGDQTSYTANTGGS